MKEIYKDYLIEQLKNLMAIDSTSGYTGPISEYLDKEIRALGFEPIHQRQGGVLAHLGGKGETKVIIAHVDDIGLQVTRIKPNGCLAVTRVGGLHPAYACRENVVVTTRRNGSYTGTVQHIHASLHIRPQNDRGNVADLSDFDRYEIVLDEDVHSAAETEALGIMCGDFVHIQPRLTFTEKGYVKSQFLDDKACAAALLAYMKYIAEEKPELDGSVWAQFTMFEEIGHGPLGIPADVAEVVAMDIGPVGPTGYSNEKKVSICVKDAFSPYHYDTITKMMDKCDAEGVKYVLDSYAGYGSDANTVLRSGHDVRCTCIGPGVLATHGYERCHKEALWNTWGLLKAYFAK